MKNKKTTKTTDKKLNKEKPEKEEIKYCECGSTNGSGYEPGPHGRLICSACGGYACCI